MSLAIWRHGVRQGILTGLLPVALWFGLCGLVAAQDGSECPGNMCRVPPSSFTTMHNGDQSCYPYGTALSVQCVNGFIRRGGDEDDHIAVCYADGEWVWSDSCVIDTLSVIIAGIAAAVVICVFFLIMYLILTRKRRRPARKDMKDKEKTVDGAEETTQEQ